MTGEAGYPREAGITAQAGRDALVAGRDINFVAASPAAVARSAYLEQVRRIAPPVLRGRDSELDALAQFCLSPSSKAYVWWQAGPWAGKSALLSTFVLSPPPGVRIVSFFITARLAAQNTREAFIAVVLEELAEILEEPLPPVLPAATQDSYLLDLLSRAAARCADSGERLVLVVDGLDEDCGISAGHSIAGLLPRVPPGGMRVIVAGRHNPPVPDDVPDWHPLRDLSSIRPLSASPYASDLQRLGKQELRRLLRGSAVERDVLGLLAAARGGLSCADLSRLASVEQWKVEDVLHTASGRTLLRRPSLLPAGPHPDVYLLGHEELQAAAVHYLGDLLGEYLDRLHSWADSYRSLGWPAATPEYLLAGYFRLLSDIDDVERMASCAIDVTRHNRLLDLTGGDASALAETRAALDRIAASDEPDLGSALAIACHRDRLVDRNLRFPHTLPGVWATLGQLPRALALAEPIRDLSLRANALGGVAAALFKAGQQEEATAVATQAKNAFRSITSQFHRGLAVEHIVEALVTMGQYEEAESLARSVASPELQIPALDRVAEALAEAERYDEASEVALSLPDQYSRALSRVTEVLVRVGRYQEAQDLARSIGEPHARLRLLSRVIERIAAADQHQDAEFLAESIPDPFWRSMTMARVAGALGKAGRTQQAAALAARVQILAIAHAGADLNPLGLAEIAGELTLAGQKKQAHGIAVEAGSLMRPTTEPGRKFWQAVQRLNAQTVIQVMQILVKAGLHEQARNIADSGIDPSLRTLALTWIADELAKADRFPEAEATARAIPTEHGLGTALTHVVTELAKAGRYQEAESLARTITVPHCKQEGLGSIGTVRAEAGQYKEAEHLGRSITDLDIRARTMAAVTRSLLKAGRHQEAETLAHAVDDLRVRADLLTEAAAVLAEAGQGERAAALAMTAESLARSITRPEWRASDLVRVMEALAEAGQEERIGAVVMQAKLLVETISDPGNRAEVLAELAMGLATAGRSEQAAVLAEHSAGIVRMLNGQGAWMSWASWVSTTSGTVSWRIAQVAEALAKTARYRESMSLARSITVWDAQMSAFAEVAGVLAEARHDQEAAIMLGQVVSLARTLARAGSGADALAWAAKTLAKAGQHQEAATIARRAEAMATTISDQRSSDPQLARIAEALAEAGQYTEAESAARSIREPDPRAHALANVAKVKAQAGLYREAEALARSLPDPRLQARALSDITAALAKAGRYREAETLAASITDPHWGGRALAEVAAALARAGETGPAARLAGECCATGSWTTAVRPVLLLAPSAYALLFPLLGVQQRGGTNSH